MTMMEKYGEALETRNLLVHFLEELQKKGIILAEQYEKHPDFYLPVIRRTEEVVDQFLGIDQQQLDKERRELLQQFREKVRGKDK